MSVICYNSHKKKYFENAFTYFKLASAKRLRVFSHKISTSCNSNDFQQQGNKQDFRNQELVQGEIFC